MSSSHGIANFRNQSNIAFRSLLVTSFRIEKKHPKHPAKGQKKRYGDCTILDAKDMVCEMLEIPERERENSSDDLNGDDTPKCTVVLNHKILETLAKKIAEVKAKHYPKFERTLFTFVNAWKDPTRHMYARWFHRFTGKTKVSKVRAAS